MREGLSSDAGERLLVVEDEEHLAAALKLNLELEGYRVDVARNGRDVGQLLLAKPYDAMILDVMLPDVSGFSLCRTLREAGHYLPIVMLTARSGAEDRVEGLESGADDYLPKPFELEELLARVRSVLRRRRWERAPTPTGAPGVERVLRFGDAEIDFETAEARMRGEPVNLTRLERDLLEYFARHPGRVLPREELLANVWNLQAASSYRTVDNFISRLRRHFEADPAAPRHFLSVRGSGYRFSPEGHGAARTLLGGARGRAVTKR